VAPIALRSGEVRSTAINIRNSSGNPLSVTVDYSAAEAIEPGWIEVRPVAWTGDADGAPVALALLPPLPDTGSAVFTVPAGVTEQLWITLRPKSLIGVEVSRELVFNFTASGTSRCRVPLRVSLLPGRFPTRPRLHLEGWDYLDGGASGVDARDRKNVAALLKDFGMDIAWAAAEAMPFGIMDGRGNLVSPPSTKVFDAWIELLPRCARYRVFLNTQNDLSGLRVGTPEFNTGVKSWAKFWAAHAAKRGIEPRDIDLLFVDEPHEATGARRQIEWARALRGSDSGLQAWADPAYPQPETVPEELLESADTLCLHRKLVENAVAPYRSLAARLRASGKNLELYGTEGPASRLDPYTYYRLQGWRAFELGATAIGFWAFTDTGGASSWREYLSRRPAYAPLFIGDGRVSPGKHLYAIREGIEDFEYLAMLRDEIECASRGKAPRVSEARVALEDAVREVTGATASASFEWKEAKDRSSADRARLALSRALAQLSGEAAWCR
jgi:hypothetical protein